MTPGWAVAWRGKSCTVFLTPEGGWSLDPAHARVFDTWGISARGCWHYARCFGGEVLV